MRSYAATIQMLLPESMSPCDKCPYADIENFQSFCVVVCRFSMNIENGVHNFR